MIVLAWVAYTVVALIALGVMLRWEEEVPEASPGLALVLAIVWPVVLLVGIGYSIAKRKP